MKLFDLFRRQTFGPSVTRWFDLLSYAAVGVLCVAVAGTWIAPAADRAASVVLSRGWSPEAVFWLTLAAAAAAGVVLQQAGLLRFRHLRHVLRYPPLWVAAVLGAVLAVTLNPAAVHGLTQQIAALASLCGGVAAGGIFASAYGWLRTWCFVEQKETATRPTRPSTRTDAASARSGLARLAEDPNLLEQWLVEERPVSDADDDLFDAAPVARRVADRLREGQAVALIGPYGSGKTSVRLLAQQQMKTGSYWFCEVAGWGLAAEDAPARVLRAVVAELGLHVEVLRLAGLPSRYRAAVRAGGSKLGLAADALIGGGEDPLDVLGEVLSSVPRNLAVLRTSWYNCGRDDRHFHG